jgi:hypothetical protein
MKADIKRRWVERLRSGKDKQGKHRLLSDDGSKCCLALLCDLHAEETGGEWSERRSYFGNTKVLPKQVCEWAGLSDGNPYVKVEGQPYRLNVVNDIRGKSFAEIADLIEASLSGNHGEAVIFHKGEWVLISFSCPMESLPPQGEGFVVSRTFQFNVKDGRMYSGDLPVHHEVKETQR